MRRDDVRLRILGISARRAGTAGSRMARRMLNLLASSNADLLFGAGQCA
jgi:hypothetical protein